ncbi:hypothetical protein [Paenibacillus faecalis]|nr:hypothetical protein [Paenibacillus faecalis]
MSVQQETWRVFEGPLDSAPEEVHMDSTQLNKLDQRGNFRRAAYPRKKIS